MNNKTQDHTFHLWGGQKAARVEKEFASFMSSFDIQPGDWVTVTFTVGAPDGSANCTE